MLSHESEIIARTKVAIVNYGMGNLRSVMNAINSINHSAFIANEPDDLNHATHIILPGVGAFGDGIRNLRQQGWVEELESHVFEQMKPFLGICLGMQLLATTGTEHGEHQGLGWVPGIVERLQPSNDAIRIPHIGWNDVLFLGQDDMYAGLGTSQVFYFVHSYVFMPDDLGVINATANHGVDFAASLTTKNIHATQFHPEKSQRAGLTVLKNFLQLSSANTNYA